MNWKVGWLAALMLVVTVMLFVTVPVSAQAETVIDSVEITTPEVSPQSPAEISQVVTNTAETPLVAPASLMTVNQSTDWDVAIEWPDVIGTNPEATNAYGTISGVNANSQIRVECTFGPGYIGSWSVWGDGVTYEYEYDVNDIQRVVLHISTSQNTTVSFMCSYSSWIGGIYAEMRVNVDGQDFTAIRPTRIVENQLYLFLPLIAQ